MVIFVFCFSAILTDLFLSAWSYHQSTGEKFHDPLLTDSGCSKCIDVYGEANNASICLESNRVWASGGEKTKS